MSSIDLIRPPAGPSLAPGLPQAIALSGDEQRAVREDFGLEGTVFGLQMDGQPLPFWRLEPPDGGPVFLKRIAPGRAAIAKQAEAVADWLAQHGLNVPAPLAGFPRDLPDGSLAVALPFVEGRRLSAKPRAADVHALGRAVGLLHRALAEHPARDAWAAATAQRLSGLNAMRDALAMGHTTAGPDPAAVQALANDPALDFAPAAWPCQPLHGDLNSGNVLLEDRSGAIVLLDFEDVFHSVLPPQFELALLLDRHVLVCSPGDAEAAALGKALLAGYAAVMGAVPEFGDKPGNVLRTLALRSLCVLAQGEAAGLDGGRSEWAKFLRLERHAAARADLFWAIVRDNSG